MKLGFCDVCKIGGSDCFSPSVAVLLAVGGEVELSWVSGGGRDELRSSIVPIAAAMMVAVKLESSRLGLNFLQVLPSQFPVAAGGVAAPDRHSRVPEAETGRD